ncbi:lipopolysaccharide biosynthesis protein [Lignipirellula cremea]|uniref:Polysaccharide biosynthesis protein n=1 Tax=Lignipirellula cremea TaxID=2528010 RepID=A0A518E4L2_9BACT|nr:lipopolysaccharide biosynthesis protein [Lignipirellula cremea]QDU99036.1 Polysaccharide biosynthesis protein [Lignipirellula cremea]
MSIISAKIQSRFTQISSGESFWGAVARLMLGGSVSHLITIAVSPIITRLYSPEQFSQAGVCISFAAIASVFITLRYEFAIVSAENSEESRRLFALTIALSAPMSLLAAIVLWVISSYGVTEAAGSNLIYLVVLPFLMFFMSLQVALRQWRLSTSRYLGIGASLLSQGVSKSTSQVAFGLIQLGGVGLVAGEAIARMVGSYCLLICGPMEWTLLKKDLRPSILWQVFKKHRDFPLLSLPSAALNSIATNLPVPLLAYTYGPEAAGSYFLIRRAISIPMALMGQSVADVFHKSMAVQAANTPEKSLRFLDRTVVRLFAIGFLPALCAITLGPQAVTFVFGEAWELAAACTPGLAIWTLFQFSIGSISQTITVYRAFRFKLIYDAIVLVGSVAAIAGAQYAGVAVLPAINLLAAANVAAYLVYFLIMRHIVKTAASS